MSKERLLSTLSESVKIVSIIKDLKKLEKILVS